MVNTATESFEDLARAHLNPLYNMAVRLVRQPQEAEDLVQETLIRAYRFFDRFEPGTNFKAWIFKILKNCFINRYRKTQREPDTIDMEGIQGGLDRFIPAGRLNGDSGEATPEQVFMSGVIDDEIEQALAGLPPDYRMVLIMAVVEEMSYKEIASALSIPIGTVMSRLHRARRQLQLSLLKYARKRGLVKELEGTPDRAGSGDVIEFSKKRKN